MTQTRETTVPEETPPRDGGGFARNPLRRFSHSHPRLTTWIIVVLLLGMWGHWAGPRWNPEPLGSTIVPETSDTTITTAAPTAPVGTYEVTSETVELRLRDGKTIDALLTMPQGVDGLVPALVFIHGTGTQDPTSFDRQVAALSSAGIATLVPQKRTEDYSLTHRDYVALSKDYEDAFEYLRGVDGVDPHRSGLYAVSEGCFIGPIIASSNPNVSFVVFVSAPVLPIRSQGALAADTYLRGLGAPEQMVTAISRLVGQQFGDSFQYIDFDVSEYQERMTMPVFMLYGTGDQSMPTIQGVQIMRADLARAGNEDLTVRYYAGLDHGLKLRKVVQETPMRDVAAWVNGMPQSAKLGPRVAGAQPVQQYKGHHIAAAPKFASGIHLLWTLGIGCLLVGASMVLNLAGLVRVREKKIVDTGRLGRTLAATSIWILISWVAMVLYVVALAYYATSYQRNDLIIQGGWAIVQICSFIAVWMSVRFAFRWIRERPRPNLGGLLVILCGLIGQLILVLMLAYWGPYPSIL